MMTSWNGNIFRVTGPLCGNSPVTGEFPAQRPVTRSFDIFFDLRRNQPLSKQWRRRWFETPSRSLWPHCNGLIYCRLLLFVGGWYCFDRSSCRGRWLNTPHLMSSQQWPERRKGRRLVTVQCNPVITRSFSFKIYENVYLSADKRKHQSSASLSFVRGIHRWPVNSPHKRPVIRKMFPFDDVIVWNWFSRT